jgi:hypothetical protein
MSTQEEATLGLRQARESLQRAEQRLDALKDRYPEGFISRPTYAALDAEVNRCTGVRERAQLNYDNALAANRGKMFV